MPDEQALRLVCDRLDIQDVLTRYCTSLDSRNWELLQGCSPPTRRPTWGPGRSPPGGGRHRRVRAGVLEGCDATQHLLGNFDVLVSGDQASACCYFQAQHVLLGGSGGHAYLVGGTYRDRLVRTPQGWRITHRLLVPTWSDGNAGLFAEAATRLTAAAG